jgi:hypothetical protein
VFRGVTGHSERPPTQRMKARHGNASAMLGGRRSAPPPTTETECIAHRAVDDSRAQTAAAAAAAALRERQSHPTPKWNREDGVVCSGSQHTDMMSSPRFCEGGLDASVCLFKQIKQRFGVGQQFRNTPFSHNLFPCKRSRCAACTTTMRTRTNLTHATRAYDRVSSCHCVKTTAAHHKPANVSSVNKNAAFVALRPPSAQQ